MPMENMWKLPKRREAMNPTVPRYLMRRFLMVMWIATLWVGGHGSPTTEAAPPLFWCPEKPPDQQFSATAEPGCRPLIGSHQNRAGNETREDSTRRHINIDNLQEETTRFLGRYNAFLDCCVTDLDSLKDLKDLQDHAADLLKALQIGLFSEQIKIRGFTLGAMVRPVSTAQHNLENLRTRLEKLRDSMNRVRSLEYEEAGKEQQNNLIELESITEDFQPLELHDSHDTGVNIQDTSLPTRVGGGIGTSASSPAASPPPLDSSTSADPTRNTMQPRTGADIGNTPQTGQDIGEAPTTGFGIGTEQGPTGSSSLPTRAGPNINQ